MITQFYDIVRIREQSLISSQCKQSLEIVQFPFSLSILFILFIPYNSAIPWHFHHPLSKYLFLFFAISPRADVRVQKKKIKKREDFVSTIVVWLYNNTYSRQRQIDRQTNRGKRGEKLVCYCNCTYGYIPNILSLKRDWIKSIVVFLTIESNKFSNFFPSAP